MVVALNFMAHGLQKVFGLMGGKPVSLATLMGAAGIIELCGGLLLLVGLYTRIAAFLCSGQMAVAYFMQHAAQGFWPIVNRGELAVLYCFIFLYLAFAGPGPLSLDRMIRGLRS
jgi:putative oxidoreductase